MVSLLEATDDKLESETACILNIHDRGLQDFPEAIHSLAAGCHLVVTAVDGNVDHYLKAMLEKQEIEFRLCGAVCVIRAPSAQRFIKCASALPEVAFYCCADYPPRRDRPEPEYRICGVHETNRP